MKKNLKILTRKKAIPFSLILTTILLSIIGVILILDDLVFHWFGDLSWVDGYNPYTKHWMIGVVLIFIPMINLAWRYR